MSTLETLATLAGLVYLAIGTILGLYLIGNWVATPEPKKDTTWKHFALLIAMWTLMPVIWFPYGVFLAGVNSARKQVTKEVTRGKQ